MGAIKSLLREFGLRTIEIREVPESHSSRVYDLLLSGGGRVILKIPYSEEKFRREKKVLRLLQEDFPVPKLLEARESSEGLPSAMLLSRIDGEPAGIGDVDPGLSRQMGRLLGRLHQITWPEFGLVPEEPGNWNKSLEIAFSRWLGESGEVFSSAEINRIERIFFALRGKIPSSDGPVLVHMDYRPGNILIGEGELRGLIDFESSGGGRPEIDFAKIKAQVWENAGRTREPFLMGYREIRSGFDPGPALDFYDFFLALGAVAWSLRRRRTEDEFYRDNLARIRRWRLD